MAQLRVEITTYHRSDGSAVGAAAYRAREKLHELTLAGMVALKAEVECKSARHGKCHNFTRHGGADHDVLDQFIRLPQGAPAYLGKRENLWSFAEFAEGKRQRARNAREILVSLPHELSAAGRANVAHAVADFLVDRYRIAVDAVTHAPPLKGDERHHHVHFLCSTRRVGAKGFEQKANEFIDRKQGRKEVEAIREKIAEVTNAELQREGIEERVDHRSGRRQLSSKRAAEKKRQQEREAAPSPVFAHAYIAWAKLDRERRHSEDPVAQDRTTKLEIADQERIARHQVITERVAIFEARVGRKASRRERRWIAKAVDHRKQLIERRQPVRSLSAEQIKQLVRERKARDAQVKQLEPLPGDASETLALKLDFMRQMLREVTKVKPKEKTVMDETRTAPKDNDNQPGKDATFDKDRHDAAVRNLQERLQDLERSRGPESVHDKVRNGIAAILEKTKERELGRTR